MKNHFNDAAYGYKRRKKDCLYTDTWQIYTKNTNNKLNDTWYSSTTTHHKGFGEVNYQVTRDADFAIYIAETAAKAIAQRAIAEIAKAEARAQLAQAAAQLAVDTVNKACAEAIAEHAAPRTPSLFSRLLGRKP